MDKNKRPNGVKYFALLLLLAGTIISCKPGKARLNDADVKAAKDSINLMTAKIAADVSKNGPSAWLNYFENSPNFFMVNDGQLVFTDYATAKPFILNTVAKAIPQIKLQWDHIRIDVLTTDVASIAAGFHEDQLMATGQRVLEDGYFTATAHFDGHGWKLRNAHWSSIKPAGGKN